VYGSKHHVWGNCVKLLSRALVQTPALLLDSIHLRWYKFAIKMGVGNSLAQEPKKRKWEVRLVVGLLGVAGFSGIYLPLLGAYGTTASSPHYNYLKYYASLYCTSSALPFFNPFSVPDSQKCLSPLFLDALVKSKDPDFWGRHWHRIGSIFTMPLVSAAGATRSVDCLNNHNFKASRLTRIHLAPPSTSYTLGHTIWQPD
jgi:hypothetical protein